MNLSEELGLLPIAGAVIQEVLTAAPEVSAGQPFDVSVPGVRAWNHGFTFDFAGTPVTATTPPAAAPHVSWLQKEIAIVELAGALIAQGAEAYAEGQAGQAFAITARASLFGHEYDLKLSASPEAA